MKILTFDIEEWFHILDHESTKDESSWNKYENRIEKNMERIFQLLANNKQTVGLGHGQTNRVDALKSAIKNKNNYFKSFSGFFLN